MSKTIDKNIRVLLVEDDKDSGRATTDMLRKRGFDINLVTTGADGFEAYLTGVYDVAVMDVRLGDMSGTTLLKMIRERDPEFPVIMYTAYMDIQPAIDAMRFRAQDYVFKPLCSIEDLVTPIKKAVRNRQLDMENRLLAEKVSESESFLRSMLASIGDMVFVVDKDKRFVFVNMPDNILEKDVWRKPRDMIGRAYAEVMPAGIAGLFDEAFQKNSMSSPAEYEYQLKIGGENRFYSAKLSPLLRDGKFSGSVSVVRDISSLKEAHLHQQQLTRDLQVAGERERVALADDLHDYVLQDLAMVMMGLEKAGLVIADNAAKEQISGAYSRLREVIDRARSLNFDLKPAALAVCGLYEAIRDLADELARREGMAVKVFCCGEMKDIKGDEGLLLFRVVRELLMNIKKHSHVSNAEIRMTRNGREVRIEITDEGMGFDVERVITGRIGHQHGLLNAVQRIDAFGGTMKIESRVGVSGTKRTIIMPLAARSTVDENKSDGG